MALEKQSKKIGEYVYLVTPLESLPGLRMIAKIANLLGPGAAAEGLDGTAAAILGNPALGPTFEDFCTQFAALTEVDMGNGKVPFLKNVFNTHFAANYYDLFQWFTFCLEVNFASFLKQARDNRAEFGARLAALLSPSESPKVRAKTG